jgi:TnpA family transposase
MNFPADIINVVIENLRTNKNELPAFNQLSRLVKHARFMVNNKIFRDIYQKLKPHQITVLEDLLEITEDYNRTDFNGLKQLPKKATISHFRELIKHHDWLMSMDDMRNYLANISKVKLQQFAQQARSLDASDLKKFTPPKRYALMISLIFQSQCRAKDALAMTFCKTLAKMHKRAKEKLEEIKEQIQQKTHNLLHLFSDILVDCKEKKPTIKLLNCILDKISDKGGAAALHADCERAVAYNSKNYLPLLWDFYEKKRSTLFKLLQTLDLQSATQNDSLIKAMHMMLENQDEKSEYLSIEINLSFTTEAWRKLIVKNERKQTLIAGHHLEICIFSHLAEYLHSGDIFISGAESYADYRKELLSWDACITLLKDYCKKISIPNNARDFVELMRINLINSADNIDQSYPDIEEFVIDDKGNPMLKKRAPKKRPPSAIWLANKIKERMPERNIVDILCSTHHYTGWANVFGPISGSDPKIDNATERYIYTNFAYGSGMGPTQAAQHIRTKMDVTPHMLSWINRRHVTPKMLDSAREQLINCANTFPRILAWGDGNSCAADGNLRELHEENLIAEFHVRYGKKGGIAYHHVANNYIALFSTFIPCGVWEAVAIIEGLLQNKSDVQPNIIHADTQGQSTVVFALAYLLGFKLMPRIRNWKDLKFFRPYKKSKYENIDSLFNDTIKWNLIETHWQDMMQVVLSIKAGKISSSLLLRKLGNYSRKNKLYLAFQELGRVIRTQFLLEYISDVEMRETITDTTNKVEAYNGLSEWASFGSRHLVASNDEDEMEKAIKYNDILTDSIILQNIVDETNIIGQLKNEGFAIKKGDAGFLSPYLTAHIKRYGDYIVDMNRVPKDISVSRSLVLW